MWRQRKKLAQAARLSAAGQLTSHSHDDQDQDDFDEAMAALGLCATEDDDTAAQPEQVFYLWPENVGLWSLWGKLQTQWRSSMNGRDGLDYTGVLSYLQHVARIKPRHMDSTMTSIQAMEIAALNEWARQAKDKQKG